MGRALFVGRFQPLHKGHEYAINYILEREDELIIAVGSAQENFTLKNPLTCGERIEILWEYLKRKDILDRCVVCAVPDINNNFLWPRHVMSLVPRFDVVYSGNLLVLTLFENMGIRTHRITEINRGEYSGTIIRERIIQGKPWEHLVPKEITPVLERLNFVERIRKIWEIYEGRPRRNP